MVFLAEEESELQLGRGGGCVCVCGLVFFFLTNKALFNWEINTTRTKVCRSSNKLLQEGRSEAEFLFLISSLHS